MFNWSKTEQYSEPNVIYTLDGKTFHNKEEYERDLELKRKREEEEEESSKELIKFILGTDNFVIDPSTGLAKLPENFCWVVGEPRFYIGYYRTISVNNNSNQMLSYDVSLTDTSLSDITFEEEKQKISEGTLDLLNNRKRKYLSESLTGHYPPNKI